MAIFSSKDEKELDQLQKTLAEEQVELEHEKTKVAAQQKAVEKLQAKVSATAANQEQREQDLRQRELDAKNGFVKQQQDVFHELIETRLAQLDERQSAIDELEAKLADKARVLAAEDGALAELEREVGDRERAADGGFAEKNRASLREIEEQQECLDERKATLQRRHEELQAEVKTLQAWRLELDQAETERTAGYVKERKALDKELNEKRKTNAAEMTSIREKRTQELDTWIEQERTQRLSAIQNECEQMRSFTQKEIETQREKLNEEQKTHRIARKELVTAQSDSAKRTQLLEHRERLLEATEEAIRVREADLDVEMDKRIAERHASFEVKEKDFEEEAQRLREALSRSDAMESAYEELKRRLGDEEPEVVVKKLNSQEERLKHLREELLERPTEEMRNTFDQLKNENESLKTTRNELQQKLTDLRGSMGEVNDLKFRLTELESENRSLSNRNGSLDRARVQAEEELERLRASYESSAKRDERIKNIETCQIEAPPTLMKEKEKPQNELVWLQGIEDDCADYGMVFPKRILYAFHTALKTAEWSPLTVLAGVSGTGKSQLPELYAHFGGMNFLSLAVQPSWDSQESMLGFFNSIDNEFDAQPVLKLLAQTQKEKDSDYPGLRDSLTIILMDEMNLAHVEQYFAGFLSKLELRRGCKEGNVKFPVMEIKLGAKMPAPYRIPLGRNVLWTGTMNQDETTKSLSDKVLDRGIVIHFPRPTQLESRKILKDRKPQTALLPKKTWGEWWAKEITFEDEQILPYKRFVEKMNGHLSKVGRALGHRVWQSLEYYMANYPTVRAAQESGDDSELEKAMDTAFEDQLVQKIMPKLRGIETRKGSVSRSDCLDKIRDQLVVKHEILKTDFDLACEFGHGVFIWNSANYLRDSEETSPSPAIRRDVSEPGDAAEVPDTDMARTILNTEKGTKKAKKKAKKTAKKPAKKPTGGKKDAK